MRSVSREEVAMCRIKRLQNIFESGFCFTCNRSLIAVVGHAI